MPKTRQRVNQVWVKCNCEELSYHRVPADYGIHSVHCPHCGQDFCFALDIETLKPMKEE
jgi:hypothetical protein